MKGSGGGIGIDEREEEGHTAGRRWVMRYWEFEKLREPWGATVVWLL